MAQHPLTNPFSWPSRGMSQPDKGTAKYHASHLSPLVFDLNPLQAVMYRPHEALKPPPKIRQPTLRSKQIFKQLTINYMLERLVRSSSIAYSDEMRVGSDIYAGALSERDHIQTSLAVLEATIRNFDGPVAAVRQICQDLFGVR